MTPYTPDLLRRPIVPCTSTSRSENSNLTNGDQRTMTNSTSANEIKHQVYTNNNHVILYQRQLDNYGETPSSSNSDTNDWKRVKCVLVGDASVGKTSLIVSYTTNGYPQEYVPTAFDNYSVSVRVDNQQIKLQLCDTAGQDEFDTLRLLCYPNADVFLVCFSVVNPTSFENVKLRWIPEIRKHSPRTPFILVGTESDLRTNIKVLLDLHRHHLSPISEIQARRYAEEIGASTYLECSSLTQHNLKETFDAAILIGMGAVTVRSDTAKNGNRRSIIAVASTALPARKSLRKLKEKFTSSRTNSMDSSKNQNLFTKSNDFKTQPSAPCSIERYSTHSSASHLHLNKKKLSTASVPTLRGDMNVVVTSTGLYGDHSYGEKGNDKSQHSHEVKSKKGWRKLLCVA